MTYSLDLESRVVAPFGVTFRDVLAGKDTLSAYVSSVLSDDDRAMILATCAESIAEEFEADRADYLTRANARKVAAWYEHESVESSDLEEVQSVMSDAEDLVDYVRAILADVDKASASFHIGIVHDVENGTVEEFRIVRARRDYGKPARVIDPNLNNGI